MLRNYIALLIIIFSFNITKASNIKSLVDTALANNSGYLAELNKQKSLDLDVASAKSYLYPQITFSAGATKLFDSTSKPVSSNTDSTNYNYEIRLTQPIIVLEALGEIDKINYRQLQAEISVAEAKNQLILDVVTTYLDILKAQDSLKLLEVQTNVVTQQQTMIERKIKEGLAKSTDITEVKVELANLYYNYVTLQSNLQVLYSNLQSLVGKPVTKKDVYRSQLSGFETIKPLETPLDKWQKNALNNNLSLLKLRLEAQIADKELDTANYAFLPTLTGVASYGQNYISKNPNDVSSDSLRLGLNLNVNLFAGGKDSARRKKAKLNKSTVQYNLTDSQNKITTLVANSYNQINSGIAQVSALNTAVALANQNYNAVKKSYLLGLKSSNDVLSVLQNQFSAQNNLINAKYNILSNIIKLYGNLGEISADNVGLVDEYLSGK